MRRIVLLFVLPVLLSALLFAGCEEDSSPGDTSDQPYVGHPLVGTWLQLGTTYHYDGDDDLDEPSPDSTWFTFNASGTAVYKQSWQGGYHEQLYEWSVADTLLTLNSDISLNTGVFAYEVAADTFRYTLQLSEPAGDGLTGWTYAYRRLHE